MKRTNDEPIGWRPLVLSASELNQPEWNLLSYFKTGILVITKLKSAIPE
jgi:hypothetical protein